MKKRFGQHFLTDRSLLRRIVTLAAIQPNDLVVEIGPGAGALTPEAAPGAGQPGSGGTAVKVVDDTGRLLALAEPVPTAPDVLHPSVVLV